MFVKSWLNLFFFSLSPPSRLARCINWKHKIAGEFVINWQSLTHVSIIQDSRKEQIMVLGLNRLVTRNLTDVQYLKFNILQLGTVLSNYMCI